MRSTRYLTFITPIPVSYTHLDVYKRQDIVTDLPVFRPVIGMDKREIIAIANEIDTFETSILPYEDCCTVFTPKHPRTRPRLDLVEAAEQTLDVDGLIAGAVAGIELVEIKR